MNDLKPYFIAWMRVTRVMKTGQRQSSTIKEKTCKKTLKGGVKLKKEQKKNIFAVVFISNLILLFDVGS